MAQVRTSGSGWILHAARAALAAACLAALGAAPLAAPVAPPAARPATRPAAPQKPSQLYTTTAVWEAHLTFTPAQWGLIEPKQEPNRRAARAAGPGGRNISGPAITLMPAMMKEGDADHNGKLSKAEFTALGEKWFVEWDQAKAGRLDAEQLRIGLNGTLASLGLALGAVPRLQGAEGKRNGLASAYGIEFQYVRAGLEFQGVKLPDVGVRYKGNGTFMQSRGSLKRSLKVDVDHYTDDQKFAGEAKLNFHNNVTDPSWMNEVLSHRLYRDAGVPAPRTAYARVYITVPGKFDHKYFGLYSMVEDIDKHFAKDRFGTKEGAIFKPVTPDLFAYLGDDWSRYNQTYDPKNKLTKQQEQRLIDLCKLVTKASDEEFAARIAEFVDLDETARYLAVTTYLSTLDSILALGQNFYIYLDPASNRFSFLPWDLDHSFGQFGMMGSQEAREQLSILHPWRGEVRFLERLYKVESFRRIYLAHFAEFNQTLFKPARFAAQVDELAAALRPAVKEESEAMLVRFDRVVKGELPDPPGEPGLIGRMFGGGNNRREARGSGMKPIKAFVIERFRSVLEQVAGKSKGQTFPDEGFGSRRGFGPGNFLGPNMVTALDTNKDGQVSREEFQQGFARWFDAWNTDKSGALTEEQLAAGLNKDLQPAAVPRGNARGGGRAAR